MPLDLTLPADYKPQQKPAVEYTSTYIAPNKQGLSFDAKLTGGSVLK